MHFIIQILGGYFLHVQCCAKCWEVKGQCKRMNWLPLCVIKAVSTGSWGNAQKSTGSPKSGWSHSFVVDDSQACIHLHQVQKQILLTPKALVSFPLSGSELSVPLVGGWAMTSLKMPCFTPWNLWMLPCMARETLQMWWTEGSWETSPVVQWLGLRTPDEGGPGLIPGQGTRSCMLYQRSKIKDPAWCSWDLAQPQSEGSWAGKLSLDWYPM